MTDPDQETLIGYIQHRMKQLGLDGAPDVARRTGIARSSVYRILDGTRPTPAEGTLKRLADGLGLPLTRLRELADRPAGEAAPFQLPKEFDQLTVRQRQVVLGVGHALLEASGKQVSPDQ